MTEVLERLARERADSLQRASGGLTGEAEGFLIFSRETCSYLALLSLIWEVMMLRLHRGGVPAKLLVQECDLLLGFLDGPENFLHHIARVWHERSLPDELAKPIYAEVQSARERLNSLAESVRGTRELFAKAPRLVADPEELKHRVKQADEGQHWVPLRDVIAQLRQSPAAPRQE